MVIGVPPLIQGVIHAESAWGFRRGIYRGTQTATRIVVAVVFQSSPGGTFWPDSINWQRITDRARLASLAVGFLIGGD